MTLKHAAVIVLIGVVIMLLPYAVLVLFTEVTTGSFLVSISAYIIVVYPMLSRLADMTIEAAKGADD